MGMDVLATEELLSDQAFHRQILGIASPVSIVLLRPSVTSCGRTTIWPAEHPRGRRQAAGAGAIAELVIRTRPYPRRVITEATLVARTGDVPLGELRIKEPVALTLLDHRARVAWADHDAELQRDHGGVVPRVFRPVAREIIGVEQRHLINVRQDLNDPARPGIRGMDQPPQLPLESWPPICDGKPRLMSA